MPFITEELWHALDNKKEEDCIIVAPYPTPKSFDSGIIVSGEIAFEIITQVRNIRSNKGISPKEAMAMVVGKNGREMVLPFVSVIKKLSNLTEITFSDEKSGSGASFILNTIEFFIPLQGKVDSEAECKSLQKELEYTKGFLSTVMKKLNNEKFVSGAPAQVLEAERKKKLDAESKINLLEENLKSLGCH